MGHQLSIQEPGPGQWPAGPILFMEGCEAMVSKGHHLFGVPTTTGHQ